MSTKPNDQNDPIEAPDAHSGTVAVLSEAEQQWAFSAPFEGIIEHLYVDTRGNVTCGVGFLIPKRAALDRYDWQPDITTARTDFDAVRTAGPGHVASYYAKLCHAMLTPETMRAHFDAHVQMVAGQLEPHWALSTLPRPARIALVDMGFNLGVAGLTKYGKLHAAISARPPRWADAAAECSRRGIQAARNEATRQLFLGLVGVV